MQPDLSPLSSKFRAGIRTIIIVVGSTFCVTMTTGGMCMPNHFFSTNDPVAIGIAWIRNYIQTERLLVSHGYGITYKLKGVE
jgi:hypothetical protein